MNKAIEWAKGVWSSLPHQVQAGAVVFASAAATFAGTAFSNPGSCWTLVCIKHALGASVGAGLVALRAFYMRPGPGRNGGPVNEGS
jgi:hypothetical protein